MEMERESEDLEVEKSSGLEVRRRRTNGTNVGTSPEEEQKAEGGGGEAELRSVYYDADQGVWKCGHCSWTYQLIGPDRQCFENNDGNCEVVMDVKSPTLLESLYGSSYKAQYTLAVEISNTEPKRDVAIAIHEELANGNSDFKTNMVNGQKDITSEEVNHISMGTKMENGSNYKTNGGETTEIEDEITVQEHTTVLRTKLKAVDIDLERILEEQDTHDLYCPNCNSCITKRVILRKRKRSVRERNLPSKKAHEEEHSSAKLVTETTADEITNLVDVSEPDPDVFRCLSCFSFFIPTDAGFNIFRIFEKGKENHVKTSEPVPEKKSNWISSLFKVDKSTKKGSEPGISEPSESYIITRAVGDLIQKEKENSHPISMPGILNSEQSQIIYQNNGLGSSLIAESRQTGERSALSGATFNVGEFAVGGEEMANPSQVNELKLGTIITGRKLDENGIAIEETDAVTLNVGAFAVADEEMTNYSRINELKFGTIIPGRKLDENWNATEVIDAGSKLSSARFREQLKEHATGILSSSGASILIQNFTDVGIKVDEFGKRNDAEVSAKMISHSNETIQGSEASATEALPHPDVRIDVAVQTGRDSEMNNGWDILKSIVYGGLIESITSLAVVSSAAGAGASTLSIIGLGLANLIGGLILIIHNLFELRTAQDEATEHEDQRIGRYWELLGWRANFRLHFIVAVISYILVGLAPPVVYGFSFRESGDKEYKLIAVTAASLLCIALLAIGKAHVKPQKAYVKTLFYYLSLGISSSAISYVVGVLINRLLDHLGWFDQSTAYSSFATILPRDVNSRGSAWASF